MLLVDNITILKKVYPLVWTKLVDLEDNIDDSLIKIETAKNGQQTIAVKKDDKLVYLHSKYNPLREAETIVEEYKDIEQGSSILFYGIGLGYHLDVLIEKYPDVNYYIYEPVPEILCKYLSNREIKNLPSKKLKGIFTGTDKSDISSFLDSIIGKSNGKMLIVSLPTHKKVFTQTYKDFLDLYRELAINRKIGTLTEYVHQKRWIINSMKNLKEVLSSPNIILERKGYFKNKTALLVSAGPSLNEEIENIRYIKENGLAYIFSVGSAINTLLHYDIYPDAACTYDPTERNHRVLKKVKDLGITSIPLVFGTSVGYETLESYPGNKIHMTTSQDTVSKFYLKAQDTENLDIVFDAPSIAVVTLQLLYYLGFDTILLVGQNLAFKGKKRHSEGIYYSKDVTEQEMQKGIWIKDVYGNEVMTDEEFNRMRHQIEFYIDKFNDINVINTTKDGAFIEGTTFIELEKVIEEQLKESIVEENWLGSGESSYDKEYLISQSKKMDDDYKKTKSIIKEYNSILESIEVFIKNRNFNQAEKMYIKLDKTLSKMEKNVFFKTFILPMNRVNYRILVENIDELNEEKDKTLKGKRIVNKFRQFMDTCRACISEIEEIYADMKETIKEFAANNQS